MIQEIKGNWCFISGLFEEKNYVGPALQIFGITQSPNTCRHCPDLDLRTFDRVIELDKERVPCDLNVVVDKTEGSVKVFQSMTGSADLIQGNS